MGDWKVWGQILIGVPLFILLAVKACTDDAEGGDESLPYRAVVPGVQREVAEPTPTPDPYEAIYRQLPTEFPARTETGWPMHALTGGITWARIGETTRATAWADEFWSLRDPESGLWMNTTGYVDPETGAWVTTNYIDTVNPFWAVILFEMVGQHDRAVETSANVIAFTRTVYPTYDPQAVSYNAYWWPALTAHIVGGEMPADLVEKATPGFAGEYIPGQGVTPRGRYYADVMSAIAATLGQPVQPLLTDETEYCPTLPGRAECEGFYRWARGEAYVPDLGGEPYGLYNDGVIFYSIPGLGRVR